MDEIDIKKKKKRTRRIWIIMTAIIVFLGLNIIGMVVATPIIYDSIFPKVNSVDTSITPGLIDYSYIEKDYPRKKVTFTSEENKLNGYYYEVDNPLGLIIFSHGMSSGVTVLVKATQVKIVYLLALLINAMNITLTMIYQYTLILDVTTMMVTERQA